MLSFTEMNRNSGSRTNLKEGEPLEYFAKESNRIAYYENGQVGSWWLKPLIQDMQMLYAV